MNIKSSEYSETTNNVTVGVSVSYLGEQSLANSEECYIWSYSINICNKSDHTIKLLNRYWKITDGRGMIDEVNGTGVVGEQPILLPQEIFEYTSGTYLTTTSGIMEGYYEFLDEDLEEVFKVKVPMFSLDSPYCYIHPN